MLEAKARDTHAEPCAVMLDYSPGLRKMGPLRNKVLFVFQLRPPFTM